MRLPSIINCLVVAAALPICVTASAFADDPASKSDEPEPKRGDAKTYAQAVNDLRLLAVGTINYHDTHGRLPPAAVRDKNGKPTVSWRVQILPFIEQDALYKQFKLEEPWDSDTNKKLIAKMPVIYRGPNKKHNDAGETIYLAPVEKSTMFPPDGRKMNLANIRGGTPNRVMFVEANDDSAVIWTKPDDLIIDLKKPSQGLIRPGQEFFQVVMGDGSIRRFKNEADPKNLAGVFDCQDGADIDYKLIRWTPKAPPVDKK